MIKLYDGGAYLVNGNTLVADDAEAKLKLQSLTGKEIDKEAARKETMAYGILQNHNTSGDPKKLKVRFDALTSHDIRRHVPAAWRSSRFPMCLPTATTAFARSAVRSTKMTTCSVCPARSVTAAYTFRLIRQSSTSLRVRCSQAAVRWSSVRTATPVTVPWVPWRSAKAVPRSLSSF